MRRRRRTALVAAQLLTASLTVGVAAAGAPLVATSAPAVAATRSVSMAGTAFSPARLTVVQGDVVRWTNNDSMTHNARSGQGFFRSPNLAPGGVFSATFHHAGTFGYACTLHFGMNGKVVVPVRASGSAGSGWTLRWSAAGSPLASRSFDVQVRAPGTTTWRALRIDTTARTAFFNPARTGTWLVRARTDNRSNGRSSGWSPARSVAIS